MFAVECLMKIMAACDGGESQFDLIAAKKLYERTGNSELSYLLSGRIGIGPNLKLM